MIDADTLDIHGQRIRLFGVDAPEKRQPCFRASGEEWGCGQWGAMFLDGYIADRPVTCAPRDLDRYGRTIAKCSVGGTDIGEWLVANGVAVAYRRYASDYIGVEQGAKNRKAGVWSGSFEMPWQWRRQRREAQ